jgi:glycosyltransferase involved in cell wall biosynthesis
MRIGIDGRALRAGREPRGVAVYLERLLRELVRLHPEDEYRVLVPGGARTDALPDGVEAVSATGPQRLVHGTGAILRRPRLDRMLGRPELVWLPAPAPVGLSRDAIYVLTVHDLSFVHQPRDFSAYVRLWHRLARPRRLAAGARLVLTDSEHVRGELIEEWGLPAERVRAVPPGPGRAGAGSEAGAAREAVARRDARTGSEAGAGSEAAAVREADALREADGLRGAGAQRQAADAEPYVLAVGALEPRKLPNLLARAHARARERGLRAGLVFAGDGPLRAELEAGGARVLGYVSDSDLDAAYGRALCLACVSREEGFGFTPLEALAVGVPPVVSDLPVFAETVGDAALRVPVGDVEALAAALLRLEREPELRARLVEAGRARLRELSWERTARETRAAFEEALG